MPDQFQHVRTNLPFRPNARTWNECVDTAVAVRTSRRTGGGVPSDLQRPWIVVRNASTHDLDRHDAIGLNGPLFEPAENLDEFLNNLAFEGEIPKSGHLGRFAILLEDVPAGRFGRAIASGPVIANVNFNSPDDVFADVVSGGVALESGPTGSARILWAAARTGTQRAVVNLSNNPDAALTSVLSSSSSLSSSSTAPLSSGDFGAEDCVCLEGTSMAKCYEVVVSGLQNGACTSAADYNGTFILQSCDVISCQTFGNLAWEAAVDADDFGCTTSGAVFFIAVECGANATVTFGIRTDIGDTTWSVFPSENLLDCSGSLVLGGLANLGGFNNPPSTITLEPVACP